MKQHVLSLSGVLAATLFLAACESGEKSSKSGTTTAQSAPSTNEVATRRMAIENYRSGLLQAKPQLDRVVEAANQMVATRSVDPAAGAAGFRSALANLRQTTEMMRGQADLLQHLGYNEYFLDASRTRASTAQSEVLAARERFGKVGDYMVSLRNESMLLNEQLDEINRLVGTNPTSASIDSASRTIGDLNRDRVKVDNLIDLLVQSIDQARASGATLQR